MSLLQISEPEDNQGLKKDYKVVVGIDLGTTNSLVGTVSEGKTPVIIAGEDDSKMAPSAVLYRSDGSMEVGINRREERLGPSDVIIKSVKRLIGKTYEDFNNSVKQRELSKKVFSGKEIVCVETPHGKKTPVEVSSEILKHLKKIAEKKIGFGIDGAVITVPAYFDDTQRQATKDAAELAQIRVIRLLNEPTAAALAYGLETKGKGYFLVYDLGGGTFDVSILKLEEGLFSVMATAGDTQLGGDDFDEAIAMNLGKKAGLDYKSLSIRDKKRLDERAKELKEELTENNDGSDEVTGTFQLEGTNFKFNLNKSLLANVCKDLVEKTIKISKDALADAKIEISELNEIILVGGSTRLVSVRETITKVFNKVPKTDLNPDEIVCLGASLQADSLVGNRKGKDNWLLLDVIPLSLGIETMGGLVEKIIPRNSSIPCSETKEFTTFKDGQSGMMIHVVQGERELVENCRSLAKFELSDIPPMVAGKARVAVSFNLDADGVLSVEAKEMTLGKKQKVSINPSIGLTEKDVQQIILSSHENAAEDVKRRALEESRVELTRCVEAFESALKDDPDILSVEESKTVSRCLENAKIILTDKGSSRKKIEDSLKELNLISEPFAERRMNAAIQKALKGRGVDDVSTG